MCLDFVSASNTATFGTSWVHSFACFCRSNRERGDDCLFPTWPARHSPISLDRISVLGHSQPRCPRCNDEWWPRSRILFALLQRPLLLAVEADSCFANSAWTLLHPAR